MYLQRKTIKCLSISDIIDSSWCLTILKNHSIHICSTSANLIYTYIPIPHRCNGVLDSAAARCLIFHCWNSNRYLAYLLSKVQYQVRWNDPGRNLPTLSLAIPWEYNFYIDPDTTESVRTKRRLLKPNIDFTPSTIHYKIEEQIVTLHLSLTTSRLWTSVQREKQLNSIFAVKKGRNYQKE